MSRRASEISIASSRSRTATRGRRGTMSKPAPSMGMQFKGARYLGHLPTDESSGDDLDADVLASRLLDSNTVQKVILELLPTSLVLHPKQAPQTSILNVPAQTITWAQQTQESIIVFLDTSTAPARIHGFYVKTKGDQVYRYFMHKLGIGARMARSKVAESTERRMSITAKTSSSLFDAYLLGQVTFNDDSSTEGVKEAYNIVKLKLKRAWDRAAKRRAGKQTTDVNVSVAKALRGNPVHVAVAPTGVRALDGVTRSLLASIFAEDVVLHTTFHDEEVDHAIVGIVTCNPQVNHSICHLFSTSTTQATALVDALTRTLEELDKSVVSAFISETKQADPHINLPPSLLARSVARECLVPVASLGVGKFGRVYLGALVSDSDAGKDVTELQSELVTVSVLRDEPTTLEKVSFLREHELFMLLNHPNISQLKAACLLQTPWLAVRNHSSYGPLATALMAARARAINVQEEEILYMGKQIADAMAHLSSKGLVHMNLTSESCELGSNNHVVISDLSFAQKHDPGMRKHVLKARLRLNLRWLAVETFSGDNKVFSEASDVWAFATTLWTMYTGQSPFHRLRLVDVQRKVPDGLRLPQPPHCHPEIYSLLTAAWANDPELRPPFTAIVSALDKHLSNEGYDPTEAPGVGERLNSVLATLRDGQKQAALEEFAKLEHNTSATKEEYQMEAFTRATDTFRDETLGRNVQRHNPLFGENVEALWEMDSDDNDEDEEGTLPAGYETDPYESEGESNGRITSAVAVGAGEGPGTSIQTPRFNLRMK
eukprot:TRINITY_DN10540_c0_g1_i2.p1 TRINITY_DN10540_c0_g1~~TRINITY_DN10540_c0_g1_i2.p1  ORF type:complete len:775 (+),score=189.63 TRINITY_DN10540_c0_g1_i2:249-2573(+)